jgi:arylformamidase
MSCEPPKLAKLEATGPLDGALGYLSRRAVLAGATAFCSGPALAQQPKCQIGPPGAPKKASSFHGLRSGRARCGLDQYYYEPHLAQIAQRLAAKSDEVRERIGEPILLAYGPTRVEKLAIYKSHRSKAPIFVFIHGGIWLSGSARASAYPAEMFVHAGGPLHSA